MSRTNAHTSPRCRSLIGGVLGCVAWLALLVAPIAAQAMMRIDPGVPGAVICSASKVGSEESGKLATPQCQLCTVAQQAIDDATPSARGIVLLPAEITGSARPTETPIARALPRAHPPRAPPLA